MNKLEIPSVGYENFDWDIPSKLTANKKIKTIDGSKVFCHEPYAEELYRLMAESIDGLNSSKDLRTGMAYNCTVITLNEDHAIAQTDSGQSVYVDLNKERKDAKRLNISGIEFRVGGEIQAIVRSVMGTYYGSVVEGYIANTKAEFFEQIKKESLAYEARVESINKGGYLVDVQGVKCFLPGSLAAANKITDFESYIGKKFYVMIDGYVQHKDIFVVSYKKYLAKIMDQKIQELDLTKKYTGHVTGTSNFGVFVEWEDVYTGLIHKTEFENQQITGFSAGDEIEFYIKEVKEDNRLTLTLGEPIEKTVKIYDLKRDVEEGNSPIMRATVKHKRKNGALIEIHEMGLMAMIPQGRLTQAHKNLKTGDTIDVKVYEVDPVMGKIFAQPENE
jgi:small subunit ribosomal protein S1